ncbi:MAG: response regulator [Deltaproteobacteria bacterium]|nr:response regulator [Deltaproteobacteria bacterium]
MYEWFSRGMTLLPIDIGTEWVGLATTILMLLGVAFIAPLLTEIMRSKENLREMVEARTAELNNSYQDLQLELQERRKAEASLRESEEKFRTFADFTYDWECWLAPDGTYKYISPSCERITGYRAREFLEDPELLQKIVHPEDQARVIQHLREDLGNGDSHSLVFRIKARQGGERWIFHFCQPVCGPDGCNLGRRVSNRDITQYKKAKAEKAELEAQLRQAQKMEAIGTLAGGIAHDFNNILSPIIMYSEIALREMEVEDRLRPYLEQVLKSSRRASDLVKQILTISRQTERQRVLLQVSPMVKESLKLLRASLPSTIEIRQEIAPEWDWILGDPTEIYQIVMNLCTNAAHAMGEKGGILTVGLDNIELLREQTAHGISLNAGNYLRLTVQDSGQGIAPEYLDRIFEPYFTTKEVGQGTGLGLALVHGIVKNCGGGLNVVSQTGVGATFHILFPAVESAAVTEHEPVAKLTGGQERILFIDDEPDIGAAAQIILGQLGYEVTTETDSQKALAAVRAAPEKFDLIITDLTMPHLTGFALAQAILEIRPQMPIILCTGYGDATALDRAKDLGFSQVILKPIMPVQLTETVRQLLDSCRGGPVCPPSM